MTDLEVHLTPEREQKLRQLALRRQTDLAIVLENVHDPHNIGAVMRTCDAVGIPELHFIVTDARVWDRIELGLNASSGSRKWVDVFVYESCDSCFERLRKKYKHILGTYLGEESKSLYETDFIESCAIVFGNEHEGLTEEALSFVDTKIKIPQFGMVQSLNISVACAITAYEALRQREKVGLYSSTNLSKTQEVLLQDYRQRNYIQHKGDFAKIMDNED